ncbi:hypothetical protein INS49_015880 [Diaporthe citri]|uniref:uncharacterized protein n=1 Tax=Diaporthe citri TaxID=83186 RepID=UPI001C7E7A4A|nr:uncharacterized protein INS49_015880 [Diaporthe citri]KAG6356492.1 hypothetical protein INS49_015880 [Diaporthe citri]
MSSHCIIVSNNRVVKSESRGIPFLEAQFRLQRTHSHFQLLDVFNFETSTTILDCKLLDTSLPVYFFYNSGPGSAAFVVGGVDDTGLVLENNIDLLEDQLPRLTPPQVDVSDEEQVPPGDGRVHPPTNASMSAKHARCAGAGAGSSLRDPALEEEEEEMPNLTAQAGKREHAACELVGLGGPDDSGEDA